MQDHTISSYMILPESYKILQADCLPWVTFIKFTGFDVSPVDEIQDSFIINDERNKIDLRLDNVTTVQFICGSVQDKKQWLIYSLPNVKHLILSNRELLSIDSELAQFLNERIQRLDIDFPSQFEQLANTTYIYLSNVEHIYLCFAYIWDNSQSCVNTFMKILENLKTLTIYRWERYYYSKTPSRIDLDRMIKYLDINQIMKTFS